jgi:hypothetical protein
MGVFEAACSPGANAFAVWYRALRVIWMLSMLSEPSQDLLAPWRHVLEGEGEQFNDAVFKAAAKIPLEWESMAPGTGGVFNLGDFLERVSAEKQDEAAA